jgi:hypothetical protein
MALSACLSSKKTSLFFSNFPLGGEIERFEVVPKGLIIGNSFCLYSLRFLSFRYAQISSRMPQAAINFTGSASVEVPNGLAFSRSFACPGLSIVTIDTGIIFLDARRNILSRAEFGDKIRKWVQSNIENLQGNTLSGDNQEESLEVHLFLYSNSFNFGDLLTSRSAFKFIIQIIIGLPSP